MEFLSDQALMNKVRQGQLDAMGLLFERYKKVLYAFFYQLTYDVMWSEDMVQSVFYKIIRNKDQWRGEGSFKSWMFTIARNLLKDQFKKRHYRKTQSVDECASNVAAPDGTLDYIYDKERSQILQQALNKLDPDKRELVVLVKLNEMKYKEVAKMMDMNESTIKVKVFRAIRELQEYYQDYISKT